MVVSRYKKRRCGSIKIKIHLEKEPLADEERTAKRWAELLAYGNNIDGMLSQIRWQFWEKKTQQALNGDTVIARVEFYKKKSQPEISLHCPPS